MTSNRKLFLIVLGALAGVLIVGQLVMGQLLAGGRADLRTAHRHSGYMTVAVALVYIAASLMTVISLPERPRS